MSQIYSKDSLDRFGDDLCEILLSYLSFEGRFRYECLSKQWQRVVYYKFVIYGNYTSNIGTKMRLSIEYEYGSDEAKPANECSEICLRILNV
ncbi:unnamed protein product [Oppiella nova]|uniref:Uncharacterized protein n=1 Tax=Oppiella nova TaxID=334625 RepID=A0A7R9QPL0_9ACAR|nr:unnamed protein product [Oppiella nova]CAG2170348.1 unnamed protein product [Oppiella nova]